MVYHSVRRTDSVPWSGLLGGGRFVVLGGLWWFRAVFFVVFAVRSGGSLNPAVSFGLDGSNAMKGGSFGNCGAYALFELVGAGVAYGAFAVCRDEEFAKQGLLGKVEKPDYGTA